MKLSGLLMPSRSNRRTTTTNITRRSRYRSGSGCDPRSIRPSSSWSRCVVTSVCMSRIVIITFSRSRFHNSPLRVLIIFLIFLVLLILEDHASDTHEDYAYANDQANQASRDYACKICRGYLRGVGRRHNSLHRRINLDDCPVAWWSVGRYDCYERGERCFLVFGGLLIIGIILVLLGCWLRDRAGIGSRRRAGRHFGLHLHRRCPLLATAQGGLKRGSCGWLGLRACRLIQGCVDGSHGEP
ncbi:hypothetical protein F5B19DRAFT_129115 [Rostrohypoxylon terebratum]|nr:hypothetical protein F5B19DRAFT_129115 [Rostrohypoxylon terebratum]